MMISIRVATVQGKQGIWLSNFTDRENKGNLRKPQGKQKERRITSRFQFRFKFEVEHFIMVTRVIEHTFMGKNTEKYCKQRNSQRISS